MRARACIWAGLAGGMGRLRGGVVSRHGCWRERRERGGWGSSPSSCPLTDELGSGPGLKGLGRQADTHTHVHTHMNVHFPGTCCQWMECHHGSFLSRGERGHVSSSPMTEPVQAG